MKAALHPISPLMALIALAALSTGGAHAQGRTIDPSKVAPEYREAAEKRAAEKKKIADCQKEAGARKLLPRYRVDFLIACVGK